MSKFCKKCDKEIPRLSKTNTCENCQNKKRSFIRKAGKTALGVVSTVGGLVFLVIIKGKFGGPKA